MPDVGTVLATLIPLLCLGGVVMLGKGGLGSLPLVVLALLWGGYSTEIVIRYNDRWKAAYGLTSLIVLGAPIFEEVAKSCLTPLFAASRRCSWFVDGAIIGLAAGTGFAIVENWHYLDQTAPSDGLNVAIARVTSTNLMHAGTSAIVGAAIALVWTRGWIPRICVPPIAIALAMSLHSAFNRLTQLDRPSALVITAVGIGVFLVATGTVYLGLPLSRKWVRADLARRGASASEQSALGGGSDLVAILDVFESRYGAEATKRAEQLVETQRRIAIGRVGGRMQEAALVALEGVADDLRRALGLHAMTWLRSHLPVDPTSAGVWQQLTEIGGAEISAEAVRESSGLWARLESVAVAPGVEVHTIREEEAEN